MFRIHGKIGAHRERYLLLMICLRERERERGEESHGKVFLVSSNNGHRYLERE